MTMCFPALLLSTGHNQLEKQRAADNVLIMPAIGLRLHIWIEFYCHCNVFRSGRPSPATQNVLIDIIGIVSSYVLLYREFGKPLCT
jgi:hypothetical protein